jgi:hypothetical protein
VWERGSELGTQYLEAKSQKRFENGAECCEHPDQRAARAAAGPGTCSGIGLGPFVRNGGGAGSADRADSSGGVPSLGCCEEFFVEHVRPHMPVARRGRRRLFPADE